jgi:K(+)-stimulated pyrophosphate-energized sodium pump
LNPIIKFTTLFGLLAVSLAVDVSNKQVAAGNGHVLTTVLSAVFFLVSVFFVYRSFYGMRIESENKE